MESNKNLVDNGNIIFSLIQVLIYKPRFYGPSKDERWTKTHTEIYFFN